MSFKAVVVISVLISLSLHKTSESDSVLIIGEVIFPVLNSKTESPPKLIGPVKSVDAATSAKVYSEIPWINREGIFFQKQTKVLVDLHRLILNTALTCSKSIYMSIV